MGCFLQVFGFLFAAISAIALYWNIHVGEYGNAFSYFIYVAVGIVIIFVPGIIRRYNNKKQNRKYVSYQNNTIDMIHKVGCNPEKILWSKWYAIGIDYEKKLICITSKNENSEPFNPTVLGFSDIIKVDFSHESHHPGGILNTIHYYAIKIIVNNSKIPTYTINFSTDQSQADYWYGIFTAIVDTSSKK